MQKFVTKNKAILLTVLLVLIVCCLTVTLVLTFHQQTALAEGQGATGEQPPVISGDELPEEDRSDEYDVTPTAVTPVTTRDDFLRYWASASYTDLRLDADITLRYGDDLPALPASKTLDLNGHLLTLYDSRIVVGSSMTFTINDSNLNASHTQWADRLWEYPSNKVVGGAIYQGNVSTGSLGYDSSTIYVKGTLVMNSGGIVGCSARYGIAVDGGKLYMYGKSYMEYNNFYSAVFVDNGGSFVMDKVNYSSPYISYSQSPYYDEFRRDGNGAGVSLDGGSRFTMNNGTISHNRSDYYGGGVAVDGGSTFTMEDGIISYNEAQQGGGVWIGTWNGSVSSFIMNDGDIRYNIAEYSGGGVCIDGGFYYARECQVLLNGGSIHRNIVNSTAAYNGGGGVAILYISQVTLSGTSLFSNEAANGSGIFVSYNCIDGDGYFDITRGGIHTHSASKYGGGIYTYGESLIRMSGGSIFNNDASVNGAGVYMAQDTYDKKGGTFTLSGSGEIYDNEASSYGGGVYVEAGSTFTMSGSEIYENIANGYSGGGVYINGGTFIMNNSGASIHDNEGNTGGGVAIGSGTFKMSAGTIENNISSGPGSGVMVSGTGTFEMSGGSIVENKTYAGINGSGVYHGSTSTVKLSGSPIIKNNVMWYTSENEPSDLLVSSTSPITISGTISTSAEIWVFADIGWTSGNPAYVITNGTSSYINATMAKRFFDDAGQCIYYQSPSLYARSSHAYTGSWSVSGSYHRTTCVTCSNSVFEHYTYSTSGYWGSWGVSGDYHQRSCSYSGYDYTSMGSSLVTCSYVEQHGKDSNWGSWTESGTTHSRKCNSCTLSDTSHQAKDPTSWDKTTTAHSGTCSGATGCTITISGSHGYGDTYYSDGASGHHQQCTTCSYETSPVSHTLTYSYKNDTYHTVKCSLNCSYSYDDNHAGWTWGVASGKHQRSCTTCSTTQDHNPNWTTWEESSTLHSRNCQDCTLGENHQAEWEYRGVDSRLASHTLSCKGANCTRTKVEEHVEGVSWTNWALRGTASSAGAGSTGEHYRTCTTCSFEDNHQTTWTYVSNGDSTSNTHTATCGGDNCNLKETLTHSWNAFTENGDEHQRTCAQNGQGCNALNKHTINVSAGTWYTVSDAKHEGPCTGECNGKLVQRNHEVEGTWTNDIDEHYHKCSYVCGYTKDNDSHKPTKTSEGRDLWGFYTSDLHFCSCTVCNDIAYAHHSETASEPIGNYAGHWKPCPDCDGQVSTVTQHNWGDLSTYPYLLKVDATTGEGHHYQRCEECKFETTSIAHNLDNSGIGSDEQTRKLIPATCVSTGRLAYWECTVCHYLFSDNEGTLIPDYNVWKDTLVTNGGGLLPEDRTNGHNWDTHWSQNTAGTWHFRECLNGCGTNTDEGEHDLTDVATWLNDNIHTGKCKVCQELVNENHTPIGDITSDAYHNNSQHWQWCEGCYQRVNVKDHDYGAGNQFKNDSATQEHYKECVDCKYQTERGGHVVTSATAHSVGSDYHSGTCDLCGLTNVQQAHVFNGDITNLSNHDATGHWKTCSICPEQIDRVDHTAEGYWDAYDWQINEYTHYKVCACGQPYQNNPHNFSRVDKKPATKEPGYQAYQICLDCGTARSDEFGGWIGDADALEDWKSEGGLGYIPGSPDYVEPHVHNFNQLGHSDTQHWMQCSCGIVDETTRANHTKSAWTAMPDGTHVQICEYCDWSDAKSHGEPTRIPGQNATCTEAGYKAAYYCSTCATYFEDEAGLAIIGDVAAYENWKSAGGKLVVNDNHAWDYANLKYDVTAHWVVCKDCGAINADNYVEHDWSKISFTITDSEHYKECSICGQKNEENKHSFETFGKVEPTTEKAGHYAYSKCADCGVSFDASGSRINNLDQWLAKGGDGYIEKLEFTVEPDDCDHDGETTTQYDEKEHWEICNLCGATIEDSVKEHELDKASDDIYHWQACECGYIENKKQHNFINWSNDGDTHTATCDGCEKTLTKSHQWNDDYSLSEDGKQHYIECALCDAVNEKTRQNHVLLTATKVDETFHSGDCYICGNFVTVEHDVENSDIRDPGNQDGIGHWKTCSVCKDSVEYAKHTETDKWNVLGNEHYKVCEECGQKYSVAEHTLKETARVNPTTENSGLKAYSKCTVCDTYYDEYGRVIADFEEWSSETGAGYLAKLEFTVDPAECEHNKGYFYEHDEQGDYGYHWKRCNLCGEELEGSRVQHTFGSDYKSDKDGHWKVCECGYTTEVKGHNFGEGEGWKVAANGKHTRICDDCGYSETESHALTQVSAGTKADCVTKGSKAYYLCEACGTYFEDGNGLVTIGDENAKNTWLVTDGVIAENNNHTWSNKLTASVAGHWIECTVCNAQKPASFVAHDWDSIGYTTDKDGHYKLCKDCGQKYDANDHALETFARLEPTETAAGHKAYSKCIVCGEYLDDEGNLIADIDQWLGVGGAGYLARLVYTEDPETCNHDGATIDRFDDKDHWQECALCGEEIEDSRTPHEYSTGVDGSKFTYDAVNHWQQCTECGYRKAETAHEFEFKAGVDGKHTAECACGYTYTEDHKLGDWKFDSENNQHYKQCEVCGKVDEETRGNHVVSSASKVDESTHKGYCDVCGLFVTEEHTVVGSIEDNHDVSGHWQVCSVCGEKVNFVAHDDSNDWTVENGEHFRVCEECGQEYDRNEHSLQSFAKVDATATVAGHEAYWQCTVCGEYFSDEAGTAKIEDEIEYWRDDPNGDGYIAPYGEEYVEPDDCEHATIEDKSDAAYHWQECADCGERFNEEEHDFTDWTAADNGMHTRGCDCGYTESKAHTIKYFAAEAATCDDYGVKAYYLCSECATYFEDANGINKIGGEIELAAWKENAGRIEKDLVNGHEFVTSESNAMGHWTECKLCGATNGFVEHDWDGMDYEIGNGKHWKECLDCGYKFNETKHALQSFAKLDPTKDAPGHQAYWMCTVCGEYFSDAAGTAKIEEDIDYWCNNELGGGYLARLEYEKQPEDCDNEDNLVLRFDENKHWYECPICGERFDENDHVYSKSNKDVVNHWNECELCGARDEENAHSYTLTADGKYHVWACECGASYMEEHTLKAIAGKDATCNEDGWKSYFYCEVCNTYFADANCTTVIENLDNWKITDGQGLISKGTVDHVWNGEYGVDAVNGQHYKKCGVCGEEIEGTRDSHKWELVSATSDNHTVKCICGEIVTEGHNTEGSVADDGNHSKSGHWLTCDVCGEQYDFADHTWNGIWNIEADRHYKVCEDCGQVYADDEHAKTIAEPKKTATDVEHGYQAYWYCGVCEVYYTTEEFGGIIGKDEAALVAWRDVPTGLGYIDIDAKNHVHNHNRLVNDDPNTHWWTCDACDEGGRFNEQPHDNVDWIATPDGLHYKKCETCGWSISEGHSSLGYTPASLATCQDTGTKAYFYCSVCKTYFEDATCLVIIGDADDLADWLVTEGQGLIGVDKENGHDWSKFEGDQMGHGTYCAREGCGEPKPNGYVEHNWDAIQYKFEGTRHWKECEDCGYTYQENGHNVKLVENRVDPTEYTSGHLAYYQCSECGAYTSDSEGLILIGEGETAGTEAAKNTWLAPGGGGYLDKLVFTESQNTCSHNFVMRSTSTNHYRQCDKCGKLDENGYQNHDYTYKINWDSEGHWNECECGYFQVSAKEDHFYVYTANEDKTHVITCSKDGCNYTYTEEHSLIEVEGKDANCRYDGYMLSYYCTLCETYYADVDCSKYIGDEAAYGEWQITDGQGKIPQDPNVLHVFDGDWLLDEVTNKHYKLCTVCKEVRDFEGDHNLDAATSINANQHEGVCTICGHTVKMSHIIDEDLFTDDDNHDFYAHWKACDICGDRLEKADHDWDNMLWKQDGMGNHYKQCEFCGEYQYEQGHIKSTIARIDATCGATGVLEYYKCTVCGKFFSDEQMTIEITNLELWKDTLVAEGGGKIPADESAHKWSDFQDDAVNQQHYKYCLICREAGIETISERADHRVLIATNVNDNLHEGTCVDCGILVKVSHNMSDNFSDEINHDVSGHWSICTVCLVRQGFEEHVVTGGATTNGNESHTGVCDVCGVIGTSSHVWDEEWTLGEDGHWHECVVCGDRKDEADHTVSDWTPVEGEDGEFFHTGACDVCGKQLTHEHNWLFGFCTECPGKLADYADGDIGIASVAIVAQLFALIAVAAIIGRRIKK